MILATIFNHNGWLLIAYMLLIMSIAIISTFRQLEKNHNYGLNLTKLLILTFAMSILPIQCGDFIYYARILQNAIHIDHFEDFYIWLWSICQNYIVWRSIIWGTTIILLILTIKKLKLNTYFASFIFVITELFYFGTMRNMLGFMLMFYAIVIIGLQIQSKHKIVIILLGGTCLYLSTFLHRSMYLYIFLLIPALLPFGKRTIKCSLIVFPLLYGSIFFLAQYFLSFTSEESQIHAAKYTDGERATTVMKSVNDIIRLICYIYLFNIVIKNYSRSNSILTPTFKFFTRYSYILLYIGLLFLGQTTGGWLYIRFVSAGELAFMFVIMYFFYYYPRHTGVKLAFVGLIYYTIYQVLYTVYASSGFIERVNMIEL